VCMGARQLQVKQCIHCNSPACCMVSHCSSSADCCIVPGTVVSIRIRIRIVTRSRGRSLLEPSRLMGCDFVASAMCDWDSSGCRAPFKACVYRGPKCLLVGTAHKGAHEGIWFVNKGAKGCATRGSAYLGQSSKACSAAGGAR
jgi:hypothetical protein